MEHIDCIEMDICKAVKTFERIIAIVEEWERLNPGLKRKRYEFMNTLSNWIFNALFEYGGEDISVALKEATQAYSQLETEMLEKKLGAEPTSVEYDDSSSTVAVDLVEEKNCIVVDSVYAFAITPRIKWYLDNGVSVDDVAHSLMCYACVNVHYKLASNGRIVRPRPSTKQWAYDYCLPGIEVFASPFNVDSTNISPTRAYYSLFEVDKKLGSLGRMDMDLLCSLKTDEVLLINPVFTEYILDSVASFCSKTDMQFVFICPLWKDARFYNMMEYSKAYSVELAKNGHAYYDQEQKQQTAKFASVVYYNLE